jgi:Tfp pilus assembly protein PilO
MTEKNPKTKDKSKPAPVITEKIETEERKTRNHIIILCVVIGLIVLGGGFLIYYLAGVYSYQANKLKAQDEQIKLLEQKQKNLVELKPNYEAITAKNSNGVSDADLILRALPTETDFNGLIAMLEKMGQQSGVKITSATQQTSQSGQGNTGAVGAAQTVGFTVAVEGSYQGLIDFLKKTEQSSRVINFVSMALTGGSGQPIQANLTMNSYWQPPADIKPTTRPLQ